MKSKAGRKAIGETRKISLTLPKEDWEVLEKLQKELNIDSQSALIRGLLAEKLEGR